MSSKNKFNYFLQLLTSENTESIKINTLILLEQEYTIIDDKTKTTAIFKLLDNLYGTDSSSTPLLKGQILLTTTTLLILLNTKDKHIHIFTNFINNILLELIKNTNNHSNAYLRETACKCLEELENEYPGILFSVLGKKTLLLFENDMNEHNSSSSMTVQGNNNVSNSNNNNALSLHSPPLSSMNKRSNVIVNRDIAFNSVSEGNGSGDVKYEKRRKELIDGGLYSLLEEEMHGVFQHYLLLYTVVLRDMIQFYVEQFKYLNNEGFKSFKMQKELESNNNNNSNTSNSKGNESECNNEDKEGSNDNMSVSSQEEQNKEIENKVYWYITHNPLIDDNNSCNSNTVLIDNKTTSSSNNNNNNSKQNPIPFSKVNYNSLSIPLSTISSTLHINEHLYNRYIFLYEIFSSSNSTNNNTNTNTAVNFPQKLSFFIKQAFCRIDNFLPKTNEIIKTKIWKLLTYIISHTEINQSALIPEFNYFHLNCNSCILSLLTIDIINYFDNSKIKCNFFLKLVIKLCLLIKDHRLNTNLRIIVLRWLINLRKNKSIKLNFAKYLQNISYELVPSPFDYLSLINEKLKSLFIFFTEVNEHNQNGSSFILNSVSIMDSYKYYSIFSNYIKSLFRTYLFIIVRYPYKNIIIKLSETLKNNIKEVPRTLPYVINLLRIVKNFAKLDDDTNNNRCSSSSSNIVITTVVNDSNTSSQKMLFKHINELLLLELSGFLKEFRSHAKLKKYLELLLEIAKSNEIPPTNIITSLNNLYTSIKDLRDWKTEKNIIEICKVILIHHDLNIVKQNNLQKLLYDLSTCSFDYGIREKAKLYYELVIHTEKAILLDYLDFNSKTLESNLNISQIHIEYDFNDVPDEMKELICLEQSVKERSELNINDRGTAIFDCELHTMMQLLSSPFYDKTYTRYTDLLLTPPLNEDDKVNYRVMNDYLSRSELNDVINNHIDGSDILRLFIKDDKINDINNSSIIDETKVFKFSNNVVSSGCGVTSVNNDSGNCSFDVFMKKYIDNIKECRFYIKLPVSVSLAPKKEGMNCKRLFSLCLCFCSIPELDIQSPVLIPFLSQNDNNSSSSSSSNMVYPYYYKFYLVIYPKLPIPSEIKSRAVCFNDKAHCNTGIIQSLYVKFEDYFLPITIPLLSNNNTNTTTNTVSNDISPDIKENIFNYFWKHFKELNIVNTNRTFNLPKAKVTSLIKQKLFPFLINQHYLQTTYHIPNPYTAITHNKPSTSPNTIIKSYFNITTEQYNNNDYDFSLDAYINPKHHNANTNTIYGEYHLAKVLIFIPQQYHMLFKIKISSLSTIIYIRSDCEDILEYLDDYFDSWDDECSLCNKLELPFNNENDMS